MREDESMLGAVRTLKALNSRRKDHLYHAKSNRSALLALKFVEKERGALSPSLRAQCNEYASSVLKDIRYAPWLYFYSAVSEKFCEGWLPSNYWGRVVVPKIQGQHGRIAELKSLNHVIFRSGVFPDQVLYVNDTFVTPESEVINVTDLRDVLFASGSKVIFKPDNSRKGLGIRVYEKDSFDPSTMIKSETGVFQRIIKQEEGLASFFRSAVSTLRLTTVINNQGFSEVRSAHLRLGTGGDTHVRQSTQIRIPVILTTGVLNDFGYSAQWSRLFEHPSSNRKFSGFAYPNFKEAVKVVCQLHRTIPFIKCIGWDVCVDNRGVVNVMEWNGRQNGVQFPEATQGPCFTGLG